MGPRTLLLLALLSACPRGVKPAAERATPEQPGFETVCSSSSECRTDSDGCRYCYAGHCSCTLPAEPQPVRSSSKGTEP